MTCCSVKPKCIQERNFPKVNFSSGYGVISSTFLLGRCLQYFIDLQNVISEEMMQTRLGEAVTSPGSTCDCCF